MEPTSVATLLASLDDSPASYVRVARSLTELPDGAARSLSAFVLSTFTFDTVVPYLAVELARRGFGARIRTAPFGQLEQVVHDPSYALDATDVIIVAMRVEDTERNIVDRFVTLTPVAIEEHVTAFTTRLEQLVRSLRERTQATIVVWNQPVPAVLSAGLADPMLEPSQASVFADLDRRIAKSVRGVAGVVVFDASRVAVEVGLDAWHDVKLMHLGRIPYSAIAQRAIGRRLARTINASLRPAAKCVVVDLDNTLWGGVIGEDGLGGIALGEDFPGSAFKAFQRRLLALRDRGMLLAIASKNNEPEVRDVFDNHPDMVLRWEDFAARQIHWNDKAVSLREIAADIGIGVDALVFFDDNPVEREWVRSQLPEVTVVDVPRDPLKYASALEAVAELDQLALTNEDRLRADLYQRDTERKHLEAASGSIEEFLRALDMKVKIGAVGDDTRLRVCQLLAKTNQFNTTTRRHGAADLTELERAGGIALWMRVEDRFGDHGLVGVAIAARRNSEEFVVDSFLLSCRVLGRRVEHALLAALSRRVAAHGGRTLLGEFIPTPKNAPAASFYMEAGFTAVDPPRWWKRDLVTDPVPFPPLLAIEES